MPSVAITSTSSSRTAVNSSKSALLIGDGGSGLCPRRLRPPRTHARTHTHTHTQTNSPEIRALQVCNRAKKIIFCCLFRRWFLLEVLTSTFYFDNVFEQQELIRRWDSERELLYDDIVHVEASAYAHWTDFLTSTITKHVCQSMHLNHLCTDAHQTELSEFVLPKQSLNNRAGRINMVIDYQK